MTEPSALCLYTHSVGQPWGHRMVPRGLSDLREGSVVGGTSEATDTHLLFFP